MTFVTALTLLATGEARLTAFSLSREMKPLFLSALLWLFIALLVGAIVLCIDAKSGEETFLTLIAPGSDWRRGGVCVWARRGSTDMAIKMAMT